MFERIYSRKVLCNGNATKSYDLSVMDDGVHLMFSYFTDIYNQTGKVGCKEYNSLLPKSIKRNQSCLFIDLFFEVIAMS